MVGMFNVYRILWRFDPARPRSTGQWAGLAVDTTLSITLTLTSGGLDSPFLIYSLSPMLTASLLMNLRGALAAGGISALSVLGVTYWLGWESTAYLKSLARITWSWAYFTLRSVCWWLGSRFLPTSTGKGG